MRKSGVKGAWHTNEDIHTFNWFLQWERKHKNKVIESTYQKQKVHLENFSFNSKMRNFKHASSFQGFVKLKFGKFLWAHIVVIFIGRRKLWESDKFMNLFTFKKVLPSMWNCFPLKVYIVERHSWLKKYQSCQWQMQPFFYHLSIKINRYRRWFYL